MGEGGGGGEAIMMRAPEGAQDKRLRHRVATAFSHRRWYARKAEERAAGWDSRFVSLYRVERERAATRCTVGSEHLVGGLVVTDSHPGINSKAYSPHRWSRRGN